MLSVYTIGYGNRSIISFLSLLKGYGINLIIDVRSNPTSRFNPDYRRVVFSNLLLTEKIQYQYMGVELGGKPNDPRLYRDGKLNYQMVRENSQYQQGIEQIKQFAENNVVCLMCCELKPDLCHRKTLIAPSLIDQCVNVLHITERGLFVPHLILNQ